MFLETLVSNRNNIEEHKIINLEQRLDRIKKLILDDDTCQEEILQLAEQRWRSRRMFHAKNSR